MTQDVTPAAPAGPDADWSARILRRITHAMEALLDTDEPMSLADITQACAEREPLTEWDASVTNTGAVRAWTNLGWNLTTNVAHAGWLHATRDGFRATQQGREALANHPKPKDFFDASAALYYQWDTLRKSTPESDEQPARDIVHGRGGFVHATTAAAPVLAAWRSGQSAFAPGRAVWSAENVQRLRDYLSAHPEPDPTMQGVDSDDTRVLAAEMWLLLVGPLSDMPGSTKRSRIRGPLLRSKELPPGLPWEVSARLEQGFVHGGQALIATPWLMLSSLANLVAHWQAQPSQEREAIWSDPWALRDLAGSVPDVDPRVGALLCVLIHPGSFTTVLRPVDREAIVRSLLTEAERATGDVEKDLKTITLRLQAEHDGAPVRYDQAPLLQQWSDAERGRAWLVRGEVDQQNRVPTWTRLGIVSITVGKLTQLPKEPTQKSLGELVDEHYSDLQVVKREGKKRDVLSFVLGMSEGDLVATIEGGSLRLGVIQDQPAKLQPIGGMTLLTRAVAWLPDLAPEVRTLPGSIRTQLRFKGEDVLDLTDLAGPLSDLRPQDDEAERPDDLTGVETPAEIALDVAEADGEPSVPDGPAVLKCDEQALALRLHHADASWVHELLLSLNERKQVVLEGPPGTGKTFLVQALLDACDLTVNQSAMVQFHPTYSYEDFVEGFRPLESDTGGAALTVTPGPLKRIAEEARKAPNKPHVLVIDEINRANIAKVFGELYFLLEYRGAEVELLYSAGERFALPGNLFIIGTMNTADRSIALLDAAMRRRFVFLSMDSGEPALEGTLRRWCRANGRSGGIADLRDRLNARMLERGLDPALAFGPSYFMRPGLTTPEALTRLWRRELRPMLLEHHYGKQSQVDSWYPYKTWLEELGLAPTGPAVADPVEPHDNQV